MNLQDLLASGQTLLADGATGSMLQTMGLPAGEAPERWMLDHPEAVARLAGLYAAAGSDIVYTNTFGANRVRMDLCGMGGRIRELNLRAAELARQGAAAGGRTVFVAGSMGPTGEMLEPYGELPLERAREAFAEQAAALAEAGVDLIVCETFADLDELLLCLEVARAATSVPVFASMAYETSGRTMMGVRPQDAVARLTEAGAAGVGANCSVGPDSLMEVLATMHESNPGARLLAKPNAGLPQLVEGRTVYATGPEALAAFARQMKSLGAAIIGGCCGTTPEHLAAMRGALDE
jgi:methionine synthase I (cobalamin-dependent)